MFILPFFLCIFFFNFIFFLASSLVESFFFFIPLQAKLDADDYGAKRKAITPPVVDESESMEKKPKQEWSCSLCQITASRGKQLNGHRQGKKYKAKKHP